MGLFDAYDPSTYQPAQSGLLDRLLATVAAPTNAGQGFTPSPMDANAAMRVAPAALPPAPQNAPIAIGDYQMPRVGSGFPGYPDHDPHTGETIVQQPATLAAPDLGSHLMTGYQNFRHGGGLIGSIVAAATGQRNDPQAELLARQQAQLRQQFTALVNAGFSPQEAQLAVLNPEAGKALIAQKLGADKFAFTTLPDGTVVRQNAKTGEVAPAYQGSAKPTFGIIGEADGVKQYGWLDPTKRTVQPYQPAGSGGAGATIAGPDGQPIAIPAGVDRSTFVKEVSRTNADAATGKMTEAQAKASAFAARMDQAEATLQKLESEGTSYAGKALDSIPLVGGTALTNKMQSNGYQKYRQAAGNFVTAMLRQESGAAISDSEFDRYAKEMLPQPGDGPDVLAQKRAARAAAIEQMRRAAGPGYKSPAKDSTATMPDPLGIR